MGGREPCIARLVIWAHRVVAREYDARPGMRSPTLTPPVHAPLQEIVANAAKVQTALKLSQEDQNTISSLKRVRYRLPCPLFCVARVPISLCCAVARCHPTPWQDAISFPGPIPLSCLPHPTLDSPPAPPDPIVGD